MPFDTYTKASHYHKTILSTSRQVRDKITAMRGASALLFIQSRVCQIGPRSNARWLSASSSKSGCGAGLALPVSAPSAQLEPTTAPRSGWTSRCQQSTSKPLPLVPLVGAAPLEYNCYQCGIFAQATGQRSIAGRPADRWWASQLPFMSRLWEKWLTVQRYRANSPSLAAGPDQGWTPRSCSIRCPALAGQPGFAPVVRC